MPKTSIQFLKTHCVEFQLGWETLIADLLRPSPITVPERMPLISVAGTTVVVNVIMEQFLANESGAGRWPAQSFAMAACTWLRSNFVIDTLGKPFRERREDFLKRRS